MKEKILNLCAEYFGCTIEDILGSCKKRNIVNARKCTYYLLYEVTPSHGRVSRALNKNMASVINLLGDVRYNLRKGRYISDDIQNLKQKLETYDN